MTGELVARRQEAADADAVKGGGAGEWGVKGGGARGCRHVNCAGAGRAGRNAWEELLIVHVQPAA